jgi:hypothetical protein
MRQIFSISRLDRAAAGDRRLDLAAAALLLGGEGPRASGALVPRSAASSGAR